MPHDDGLGRRKFLQRLHAFLASVTGMFEAAKRQFHAATCAIGVDEDLAGA